MNQNTEITLSDIREVLRRTWLVITAALLVALPVMMMSRTVTAMQMTERSVAISTAIAGATANYTFTFTPPSTTRIQSMEFQACTTPLGTCTAPSGINLGGGTVGVGSGSFQGSTAFTKDTSTTTPVDCTQNSILCITRSDTTSQTTTPHVVTLTGAVNQNSSACGGAANCTFFIRMYSFSGTAYTSPVDNGVVANSTTQLFTVNAAIQEALSFCIGATAIDDDGVNGLASTPPTCDAVSGTAVNLGILNSPNINVTPVDTNNGGDGNNGLAAISTNAFNGTSVAYQAIQQSGTQHAGTLRVVGSTCNSGTVNTDQCINAAGTTQTTLTGGTERFGMTIAAINCKGSTGYVCSFPAGTYNLVRDADYDGTGSNTYPTDVNVITGTSNAGYAWDESGTADTIASSGSSAIKVLDREVMILKFAATPNVITPTGAYTAQAEFIALPVF